MLIRDLNIVLQETPGEVSICIRPVACENHCDGCHSPELKSDEGATRFMRYDLLNVMRRYDSLFSCVLFMGGERYGDELADMLGIVKNEGYKTCLYSGYERIEDLPESITSKLDYLKIGSWKSELGGLDSPNTNQKYLDMTNNEILNHKFQRAI
jgi:anaerobic ribonucleoside-triphosphate reductase activating protein